MLDDGSSVAVSASLTIRVRKAPVEPRGSLDRQFTTPLGQIIATCCAENAIEGDHRAILCPVSEILRYLLSSKLNYCATYCPMIQFKAPSTVKFVQFSKVLRKIWV